MASTINATTSGVVTTGDTVASLALQTGGTNAVTINSTQAIGVGSSPSYGTAGQFLTSQGSAASPTWTSGGSGTVTSVGWTGGIVSVATATTTPAFTIAGTSGGIPYFSSGSAWASSGALTQYGIVYGGGAGAAPVATAAGTTGQFLGANTGGAPTWQTPAGGGSAATPTALGTVYGVTPTTAIATAIGYNAASTTLSASNVTAVGFQALKVNTAVENTAVGSNCLLANTTGYYNTAVGATAGTAITTGQFNTIVGWGAYSTAIVGSNSVAIGLNCMQTTTGSNNTCIGTYAGSSMTTGQGNVVLGGYNSSGSSAPVFNITTESNRVSIGSTAVTNAYIQVAWTVVSDARDKTDFQAIPHGLSFVQQLNPVSFYFKESRENEVKTGIKRYGFKAQEILALEGDDAVIIDNENPDKLRYNGEALVPVLVKAIQELSAANEALTARIAALEAK